MQNGQDYMTYDVEKKPDNAGVMKAYADRIIALAGKEKSEKQKEED